MKYVGILAVAAVLLIGFGYFTIFGGPESAVAPVSQTEAPIQEQVTTDPADQAREDFAGAGSLQSLIERGDSVECQITYIPSPLEDAITGTFFVANGNVRGDFLTPAPDMNGQVLSSLIFDGEQIYVWSEINGEQYGFTIETDSLDSTESDTPIPTDTEVQYNCLTWPAVDNTIFEPPVNVLFTDMTGVQAQMEIGTIYNEDRDQI